MGAGETKHQRPAGLSGQSWWKDSQLQFSSPAGIAWSSAVSRAMLTEAAAHFVSEKYATGIWYTYCCVTTACQANPCVRFLHGCDR